MNRDTLRVGIRVLGAGLFLVGVVALLFCMADVVETSGGARSCLIEATVTAVGVVLFAR